MRVPVPIITAILALWAVSPGATDGGAPPPLHQREVDESAPDEASFALTVAALCDRGHHGLDDGSREALLHARELFGRAVKHYPDAACGHAGVARAAVAISVRRIEEEDALIDLALREARLSVELDPGSAAAHAALAGSLLADLQPEEASTSVQKALGLDPSSVPSLQTAALIHVARGEIDLGRAAIERALELRPGLPASHQTLGNLQLLSGQEVEAIRSYRNALALSPDFLPASLQLAAAHEDLGNYQTAGSIFKRLIQDHPEVSSRAYLYMGHSLMKRNSYNAALGAFEKVNFKTRRGLSQGTVLYLKGLCYEQLGRDAEARAAMREVIHKWPDATAGPASPERVIYPAYEALGRLHLRARQTEEAVAVMEEGAGRPEASLDLLLRLSRLYQDYSLPDRAAALLEKAASSEWRHRRTSQILAAYVQWARLAKDSGDTQALGRLVQSLQSRLTNLGEMRDYVADLDAVRALSIAGRGDLALEVLKRAVDSGYSHLEWIASDPELDALREAPGYGDLLRSIVSESHPTD